MTNQMVSDRADLARLIAASGRGSHCVYLLRIPDGNPSHGGIGTPFYVGIGQGSRLFAHEEEVRDPACLGAKVDMIRSIWSKGSEVVRTIDSIHSVEPWDREEELINLIGRLSEGKGPLTNAQTYAPSRKLNGVELRKYNANHAPGDTNTIPAKFKLHHTRLMAGPREPLSRTSVLRKIYTVAGLNSGATGVELVMLLSKVDFTAKKSAYT